MENGVSLERAGEKRPLLDKESHSSNHYEEDESVEVQGTQLQCTPTNCKAPPIILGFSFLEGIAFNGIGINLVLYLRTVLHGANSSNAENVACWGGTSYFTPLLGGLLADTCWGNYRTILISIILYLLGMIIVTLSSAIPSLKPPPCDGSSCQPATGVQLFVFFSGLYLIAFGSGGIRSALLPFGADQFNNENPIEMRKKVSFFSLFYVCSMLGVLIAGIFVVWIQENIDWAIGFGIATLCMVLASGGFLLGTPTYKLRMPTGSPLTSILQVIVASLRKMHQEAPIDANLLYKVKQKDNSGQQRLAHTDEFRFLDKAATISDLETGNVQAHNSWTLCTVTQVEELKILLRMLPIWATSVVYSAACTQMNNTFIEQGSVMNTRIGSFSIPPASLSSFGVICVMVWVLICNKIIVPAFQRCSNGAGLSKLQRMGIGRFTMIIAMATAAVVETKRLESVRNGHSISIAWQLPQYFIISGSEVFNYITQLEFFYAEAPDTMRSICTSFALLSTALGNYLSSLIITLVSVVTASEGHPGWIPDDLNKGHLDYYFYSLAGICVLNFCVYVVFARKYKLKRVIQEC